jgi:transcriptional regulator with XRE-family HTH domain
MKAQFAKTLSRHLLDYYGRIPSASVLARDFNLRAGGKVPPISPETARRWVRGLSMPEMEKLQVIVDWLHLEIGFLSSTAENPAGQHDSTLSVGQSRPLNATELALLQTFRETDIRGKRILLTIAETLIPGMIPPAALKSRDSDNFMPDR